MSQQNARQRKTWSWIVAGVIALAATTASAWAGIDDEPICYSATPAHDPVAHLKDRLDRGAVHLKFDAAHGYLASLLAELKIPTSSQGLVFSKTSFQRTLISPHNARSLYFNDDTYVGSVHDGSVLEIASMDPSLGTVFYTLKQEESAKPKLVRQTYACLQCHESSMTRDVPGLLMRSVYPDDQGLPALSAGTFVTTDQSPFAERWGGWYVTGTHGRMRHMGNVTIDDDAHPDVLDTEAGANLTALPRRAKPAAYLAQSSDIVALMVLTHQAHIHNLTTKANYEVRTALRDQQAINEALKEKPDYRSESTTHRIQYACEPLVKAMLFSGEAKLIDPIIGSSTFTADFQARGPRDAQGRSLRDFDLKHRMFRYPCSYLIYSAQFDGLPAEARTYIYQRLWNVLCGRDRSKSFRHITDEDRQAILLILRDTKSDLPEYWKRG